MTKQNMTELSKPLAMVRVLFSLFLACGLLIASGGLAVAKDAPLSQADPMVKITSLPLKQDLNKLMAKINGDVARASGLDEKAITYYWQTFDAIYCPGCKAAKVKGPIFVDMYCPNFMTRDQVHKVMTSLAEALEKYTGYTRNDVFIYTNFAEKWQLYIMGNMVTNWKQVGGPDDGPAKESGSK